MRCTRHSSKHVSKSSADGEPQERFSLGGKGDMLTEPYLSESSGEVFGCEFLLYLQLFISPSTSYCTNSARLVAKNGCHPNAQNSPSSSDSHYSRSFQASWLSSLYHLHADHLVLECALILLTPVRLERKRLLFSWEEKASYEDLWVELIIVIVIHSFIYLLSSERWRLKVLIFFFHFWRRPCLEHAL